jgi:acyl transferase domain-containing protein/acyl carrier protein
MKMSSTPENQNELSQLKQALAALKKARTRLDAIETSQKEPIAIIGMSCRFPGGANSPDEFWRLLESGTDAISQVPSDRWNIDELYDSDPAAPGRMNSRWAGFIDQIDQFDANFFGIAPREAAQMDPQQRLVLEVAWEALEDAGLTKTDLAGSQTGVYVGVHSHSTDYVLHQYADPEAIDIYTGTGTAHNVIGGRLAYLFDLRGPTLTVDTACSSSLVATHLACQSLRARESQMAIVAGVNLILSPEFTIAASKMHMLAPDGRCKAFDAQANGFVRGEGCGVVILKRLSDALATGDNILALIKGSAINQDGHTNGLTAPNGLSQQQVIKRALENSGVEPSQIGYIEAHGTGTSLGDVIELESLAAIFGQRKHDQSPCYLGSAKTNIGHLEGGAGIAGLIKTVLSLRKKSIPPVVHFKKLNPNVSLENTPLTIPVELQPWKVDQKRFAGISSFGWSGTNAHVVLQEAPTESILESTSGETDHVYLLPLSAQSKQSLHALAQAYQEFLFSEKDINLKDICYTSSVRRTSHEHRLTVTGRTHQDLSEQINGFIQGKSLSRTSVGYADPDHSHRIAFVFPGQGSQWIGMGQQLLAKESAFRDAILECEKAIGLYTDWKLTEQLENTSSSRLDEIDVIQPTLFAIQVAVAALWRSWGIEPDAVIGHSMGEIAAAHIAGALDLENAARIICTRSRLLRRVSGKGVMAVVGLSLDEAQQAVANYVDQLSVAVSNSPRSTVLSGDPGAMEELFEELRLKNIFYRLVKVDVASHSPQMDPLLSDLISELHGLQSNAATIPFYSTVIGNINAASSFDESYWADNLRRPVLFSKMIEKLAQDNHTIFIEISPHAILLPAIEETLHHLNKRGEIIPSLLRDDEEQATILSSLGKLYTVGYPVDWKRQYPNGRLVSLPSYAWDHQRYWVKSAPKREVIVQRDESQTLVDENHPLLGVRLPSLAHSPKSTIWQTRLDASFRNYLKDHNIEDAVKAMVFAGTNCLFGEKAHLITQSNLYTPLALDASNESIVQLILTEENNASVSYQLYEKLTGHKDSWSKLADGQVEIGKVDASWFYNIRWEVKALSSQATSVAHPKGHWLIFSDQQGLGKEIAVLLEANGQTCTQVFHGTGNSSSKNWHYIKNVNNPDEFRQEVEKIMAGSHLPLHGILYLWGLDAPSDEELQISSLSESQAITTTSLLHLIQALLPIEQESSPRVWVVTRGVQPVSPTQSLSAAQSLLWGFGRGIAMEHPELWGGMLDLADYPSEDSQGDDASLILAEVFKSDQEKQIAYRNGQCYVARLIRDDLQKTKTKNLTIRPDASYLVTGGLGGLGLNVARWLIDQGARHLVLTSRTGLPPKAEWDRVSSSTVGGKRIEMIRGLEAQGASVTVVKADVSNANEMSRLFESFRTNQIPLCGIFHIAGLEDNLPIQDMTVEHINEVLRSKVTGSWILHKLTQSESASVSPIEFFVMFSSAAAIWGSKGLAHYAAANHFMDILAHYRHILGLQALSVNWGWWESGGMGKGQLAQLFADVGLNPMPTEQGLAAMEHLLETDATQAVIASVDWNKFKPIYEARQKQPLLEHIITEAQVVRETSASETKSTLAGQLRKMSRGDQREALLSHVRRQVAEVLGLESPETLDIQQGFFKLGMDSITTVRLRNRLESSLECSLPPTVAFEYPNVEALTAFLAQEVFPSDVQENIESTSSSEIANHPEPGAKLKDLSKDELFALLDDEMSGIDKLTEGN